MALVEVHNVTKLYRIEDMSVTALADVSFQADAGDCVALVGKSGCGKSTLLNLCAAMDFPTSGEVILDGQRTGRLNDVQLTALRREKIGFIFQSFQLLHTLSVVENVELPLLLAKKSNPRPAALERLRWVGIEEYASRLPHQLSGGQQQRVAIARSLVHNPRLLLADEPTGNLDSATGDTVMALLRRTASELGVVVLLATHSMENASLADRTIRLRDGRVEAAESNA